MHNRVWSWLITVAIMVSVAACGGGDGGAETGGAVDSRPSDDSPADTTVASDLTTAESSPTTTAAPQGLSQSGSISVTDPDGYTYEASIEVLLSSATVEVANTRPGSAYLVIPAAISVSVTNTTPGRNLPSTRFSLAAAYVPDDFASVGLTTIERDDPNYPFCPERTGNCNFVSRHVVGVAGLAASGQQSAEVEPLLVQSCSDQCQYMSEEMAGAAMRLVDEGRSFQLVAYLPLGSEVTACSGVLAVEDASEDRLCG